MSKFDSNLGGVPGQESNGSYCFTLFGFLSITNQLNLINKIKTSEWFQRDKLIFVDLM